MTHLFDGSSGKECRVLYKCMLSISQHGSGARALKDHEFLGMPRMQGRWSLSQRTVLYIRAGQR